MEEPTNQPAQVPKTSSPLMGSRDLLDINILPDRFRRKRLTLMGALPWLLMAILLGTAFPTYQLAVQSQISFREKRLDLARVQAELDFFESSNQEGIDLQDQIDAAFAEKDAIIQSYGGLQLSTQKWSPTLTQIDQLLPSGANWTQISQGEGLIRLDGAADEYQLVIDFRDSLETLEGLADVEIDSIELTVVESTSGPPIEGDPDSGSVSSITQPIYQFTILAATTGEVASE